MEAVTIYGTRFCGYCHAAKRLCEQRDLTYEFIDMHKQGISKDDIAQRVGKSVTTVPQIFVGEEHIGGYMEFSQLV